MMDNRLLSEAFMEEVLSEPKETRVIAEEE